MKLNIWVMILLFSVNFPVLAIDDGRWQLSITGSDKIEFGTEQLAGGLKIKWKTVLEFSLKDSQFHNGTGIATLVGDITAFSRPEDIFDCELVDGTFASRSGLNFSMPHLRYKSFPLAGRVIGEKIQLNPYLDYPGNYYAILYQCKTANELGSFWIERSPRIARELSKRQDTVTKFEEPWYLANIKEVNSVSPGPKLEFPLIDGLNFTLTQQYGLRQLDYALERIGSE